MDGKSIRPLLTSTTSEASSHNDFRWAALLEMYSGSSNIGSRYKHMKEYYNNHMYPNTYQAVRVINGPSEEGFDANLLYVEWCTGEQELYNMTVDPHQVENLLVRSFAATPSNQSATSSDPGKLLPLLHRLSLLVARLGDCKGSGCYEFEGNHLESASIDSSHHDGKEVNGTDFLEFIQSSIRNRIPCHNPPNMTTAPGINTNQRRKPFAYDLHIPEPFTFGFPFSDGDNVGEDLLRIWAAYEHYFH